MSAWRRLALELFPQHREWIADPHLTFSIYSLFFDLLPMAVEAHHAQDAALLERIYNYAEWCWKQKRAPDIRNAVAVAFYEHLIDDRSSMRDIPRWLAPEVFGEVKGLFEERLAQEEYRALLSRYNASRHTDFE